MQECNQTEKMGRTAIAVRLFYGKRNLAAPLQGKQRVREVTITDQLSMYYLPGHPGGVFSLPGSDFMV